MLSVLRKVPLLSLMARFTPDLRWGEINASFQCCFERLAAVGRFATLATLTRPARCCSGGTASGRGTRTCTGSEGGRWWCRWKGPWTWPCPRCWCTGRLRSQRTRHFQSEWWSGDNRKFVFQKENVLFFSKPGRNLIKNCWNNIWSVSLPCLNHLYMQWSFCKTTTTTKKKYLKVVVARWNGTFIEGKSEL